MKKGFLIVLALLISLSATFTFAQEETPVIIVKEYGGN